MEERDEEVYRYDEDQYGGWGLGGKYNIKLKGWVFSTRTPKSRWSSKI